MWVPLHSYFSTGQISSSCQISTLFVAFFNTACNNGLHGFKIRIFSCFDFLTIKSELKLSEFQGTKIELNLANIAHFYLRKVSWNQFIFHLGKQISVLKVKSPMTCWATFLVNGWHLSIVYGSLAFVFMQNRSLACLPSANCLFHMIGRVNSQGLASLPL